MENHPIPQDVTGFKFRLIGSMTVKQFSYIMAGAIISYIFYVTPLIGILKYPIIASIMLFVCALAFVPIDGRPIDKMVFFYLKAIPRENEYVYRKQGALIFEIMKYVTALKTPAHPAKTKTETIEQSKRNLLFSRFPKYSQALDETETNFLNKLKPFFEESVFENKEIVYKNLGTTPTVNTTSSINQKTALPATPNQQHGNIFQNILKSSAREDQKKITIPQINADKQGEVKSEITKTNIAQNINRAQEIREADSITSEETRKKLLDLTHGTNETAGNFKTGQEASSKQEQSVKQVVGIQAGIRAGFPILPDIPNIVLGIIKDPRNKVLQNIIVEIIDKNNNPVRAFKTNALGQFVSATPLPNGEYKILIEDPKKENEFVGIEIKLNGKDIFSPLEIISLDAREKLRRELFNN